MELGEVGGASNVGAAGGAAEANSAREGLKNDVGASSKNDAQNVANRMNGDGNDGFKVRTVANGNPALRQGCVTTT